MNSNNPDNHNELKNKWFELYLITNPECHYNCAIPLSCCDPMYCELARDHAINNWGTKLANSELFNNGKTNLPFMGEHGCIIAPHFKPSCVLHVCQINSLGAKISDPLFTDRYFELRLEIETLEQKKYAKQRNN